MALLRSQLDLMRERNFARGVVMGFSAFGQGVFVAGPDGVTMHHLRPKATTVDTQATWQDIISPRRKVAFKGYILKSSNAPMVWNKRFFHLRDNILSCYMDEEEQEVRRVLPLSGVRVQWHESGFM